MCERCAAIQQRTNEIRRGALGAFFAEPPAGSIAEMALTSVPGYSAFLELGRRVDLIARAEGEAERQAHGVDAVAILAAMTAEGRSDVMRVAVAMMDIAAVMYRAIAAAKVAEQDPDTDAITVGREDDAIVVRLNGDEVGRYPIRAGADEAEVEDAAERAMRAHRENYG